MMACQWLEIELGRFRYLLVQIKPEATRDLKVLLTCRRSSRLEVHHESLSHTTPIHLRPSPIVLAVPSSVLA